eukprot:178168-Chlamydomonas_euryale.AAC.1
MTRSRRCTTWRWECGWQRRRRRPCGALRTFVWAWTRRRCRWRTWWSSARSGWTASRVVSMHGGKKEGLHKQGGGGDGARVVELSKTWLAASRA